MLGYLAGQSLSNCPRERATLAQLVEHPTCNRKVVGSIPMGGSKSFGTMVLGFSWVGARVVKGDGL